MVSGREKRRGLIKRVSKKADMGKIVCNCLNIRIHTKTEDFVPSPLSKFGADAETFAEFFPSGVTEIILNLEGVIVEHQCLVKKKQVVDWLFHRCINCDLYTHAINNQGKVVSNASLRHDPTSIEGLKNSADFSPLYKIALPDRNDNHPVRSLGVQSGKYESLHQVLTTIQQQLNKFLIDEESAMENRIREYQETQRSAYAALQSKVRKDKNTLINTILAAEQKEITESLSDAMTESAGPGEPAQIVPTSVSEPIAAQTSQSRQTNMPPKQKDSRIEQRPQPVRSRLSHSPDEMDGVFDFDPAYEENRSEAFYNSDDDNDDTDDSSFADDTDMPSGPSAARHMYSSSMPISMPAWGGRETRSRESRARVASNRRSLEEEEDEFGPPPDPEDMAASIKALAQSVHGDGTEIFGDLPTRRTRARIGTSDFNNI